MTKDRLYWSAARIFLLVAALASSAPALSWPDRAIQIVVPYAAGGSTDQLARMIATPLSTSLHQPVVVENRPGAGGMLAHGQIAHAPADGYSLIITNQADAINSAQQTKMSYDLVRDFAPITNLVNNAYVLTSSPQTKIATLADVRKLGADGKTIVSFASSGVGTGSHMAGELLSRALNVQMTHIPYKGTGVAATDVAAGHVTLMFLSGSVAMPLVRDGKLRAIGVSTAKRMPGAPDIPTLQELGLEKFDIGSWQGLQAPAGTPRDIVMNLAIQVHSIMKSADLRSRLAAGGSEVETSSPDEFAAFIKTDIQRWAAVSRTEKLTPN